MNLISKQYTKQELGEFMGISDKKALSEKIKSEKLAGRLIEYKVYFEPSVSNKKQSRFSFVATTDDIFSSRFVSDERPK